MSAWGLSLVTLCLLMVAVIPSAARGVPTAPTFASFVAPPSLGNDAGEPSIGSNWATGNVMYQAGLETLRVSGFNDATGAATWASVGSTITSTASLDRSSSRTTRRAARSSRSCRPTAA